MENYTKVRIIGTGSFGTVWLIRSKEKRRNYVLKEIPLSVVEERQRQFVLNEVKVLSKLRHMNIIRYREAFLSNGYLCISMEYAHEGDLSDRIQKQCGQMLPKEQIIDWFIQLCLALKYIHGLNVLHRDIKCQNIFLSKENVIKLGDFGIACVLDNTLDHAQTVIGTPYYLSPEICQRQPYNHKSDIWALGCVLYEMVTLHHPFESTDFPQLVLKILHGDFIPIPGPAARGTKKLVYLPYRGAIPFWFYLVPLRNHGTLLQDLVDVLLRVDPSERPSAKQILHIPAMQPHVNKVLARGKTQRSESVSCSEGRGHRKENVWRKPDVISDLENESKERSRNDCDVDGGKHVKGPSNVWRASEVLISDVASVEVSKGRRKRNSSEISPEEDDRLFDEAKLKKMKTAREKDCVNVVFETNKENYNLNEHGPSKHRSYSTSIVRESSERNPMSAKRSPLTPLNRLQERLRGTYDVIPEARQILQGTYTKNPYCEAYGNDETVKNRSKIANPKSPKNKRESGKSRFMVKGTPDVNSDKGTSPNKLTKFLKVLLGEGYLVLRNVSSESSLKDYVQAMKSNLEEFLGYEMFTALHKYLSFDVEQDLSSEVDVCETLFQALGEDGIVFVPLMLQFIRCEKNL